MSVRPIPISRRAPFIVLEGTDGSGVSTQSDLLSKSLRDIGFTVYVTKQPSDGPVGAMIRLVLAKRLDTGLDGKAETLALFFAADRKDHYHKTILPLINEGVTVISDRYYLSTYAFQGPDVGDAKWLRAINSKVMPPDLTVFVDVEPSTCRERIERRSGHYQLFEEQRQLETVHRSYLDSIELLRSWGEKIETVDGNRSTNDVHRSILGIVRRTLLERSPKQDGGGYGLFESAGSKPG